MKVFLALNLLGLLIFLPLFAQNNSFLLSGTVSESDFDADGVTDWRETITNKYDGNGKLLESDYEIEGNGNFSFQWTITNTYDPRGNLIRIVSIGDLGTDGTADWIETSKITYDQRGLLVLSLTEQDSNGDGRVDSRATTTYTMTRRQYRELTLIDSDTDGTVDDVA